MRGEGEGEESIDGRGAAAEHEERAGEDPKGGHGGEDTGTHTPARRNPEEAHPHPRRMRKAQQEVPPGFDVEAVSGANKPKMMSVKRNERKKEKQLQAALASSDEGKDLDSEQSGKLKSEDIPSAEKQHRLENVETVTDQISNLSVSSTSEVASPSTNQTEKSKCQDTGQDVDKRIRALRKKKTKIMHLKVLFIAVWAASGDLQIWLAEAQLQSDQQTMKPEQLEKMSKVEGWREELKVLEDKMANMVS